MIWFEKMLIVSLCTLLLSVSCVSCITHTERVILQGNKTHVAYRDSVVKLELQPGPKGRTSYIATGFAITDDHLLTAGHFCTRLQELKKEGLASKEMNLVISDQDGTHLDFNKAVILANAEKSKTDPRDMCILESKGHKLTPLPLLGDMSIVESEDPVTVMGAPRGFFPVRRDGYIISKQAQWNPGDNVRELLFLAINIEPGSSGSPVIWNGHVIGIVVRYINPDQFRDSALATRGDHVVEFVDRYINRSQ